MWDPRDEVSWGCGTPGLWNPTDVMLQGVVGV